MTNDQSELLESVAEIGVYLNRTPRRVHHLIDREGLPVFKLAGRICARRSTLDRWLAEREAAAMAERGGAEER